MDSRLNWLLLSKCISTARARSKSAPRLWGGAAFFGMKSHVTLFL